LHTHFRIFLTESSTWMAVKVSNAVQEVEDALLRLRGEWGQLARKPASAAPQATQRMIAEACWVEAMSSGWAWVDVRQLNRSIRSVTGPGQQPEVERIRSGGDEATTL